jgi:hypothetical protein
MKEHTEIICVIDRSGSMESIKNDAIGGFNSFLNDQKSISGSASLTLVLFNNRYQLVHDNVPLSDVQPLNEESYKASGTTALFYAIGKTIDDVGVRLANAHEDERPNKILFIIITDGEENASHHFNKVVNNDSFSSRTVREPLYDEEKINYMITHQREKYNWEFVFLAANQDAMKTADKLSISRGNTMNFSSTPNSVNTAYSNVSNMSKRYRAATAGGLNGNLFESNEQDVRDSK